MVSIAVSTSAGPKNYWNVWHKDRGWLNVEVDFARSYLPAELKSLENARKDLSEFYMSAHSMADAILHEIELLEKAQQYLLFGEIIIAGKLGIKELNFHLPKNIDLAKQGNKLISVLDRAVKLSKENNIQLLLENNWRGSFSDASDLLWIFEKFPQIKMCFDIGHAHISNNGNELSFIEKMAPHILNAHIHDNNGTKDEHLALGSGSMKYDEIINFLLSKTSMNRLIIENKTEEEIKKSISVLKSLLK